ALNMTSASSFQMLRGSVIIFTGLLSVAFLGRRLERCQWLGMLLTILGLLLVGLADLHGSQGQQHRLSEVITGSPGHWGGAGGVGWAWEGTWSWRDKGCPSPGAGGTRGLFGFLILALLLVPMYFIPAGKLSGNPRKVLEDPLDAFCQVSHRPLILLALLGNVGSISFFNFSGISVTKELSATTRMVLDSLRTLLVWAVSLALGWERFHALQLPGFAILLVGAALYNGMHRPLLARCHQDAQQDGGQEEREALLDPGDAKAIN
ncbi:S35F6 protein, partial [Campylorhamphus procurvoides]|nr:S35F6 protein [Campylorhamphus procurvoides]